MNTTLEMVNGKLRVYTDLGGYPLFYIDGENSALCPDCATESLDDEIEKFRPKACAINWEDSSLYCDQCSKRIESAYAEDEANTAI